MNWLITGGCGFIGLNLIKNLVEEGSHYIRIVDNLSVGTREDLSKVCKFTELDQKSFNPQSFPGKIDLIVADILDTELAIKSAEEIDVIVHLAANTGVAASVENPRSDCMNNVIGTLNYLEAARYNHVKRFIFASSGAPVGECEPPIHEELVPHPVSPYGASKLAGEAYCSAYFRTFGIETVSLRFGNVYGPLSGHKNSVVAKFIRQAMNGETLEIYGDGEQTRDFIYIDDSIRAIRLSAIIHSVGGEVFQIATNAETTVSALADQLLPILAEAGFKNTKISHSSPRLGDVIRNFSDISKARDRLKWRNKIRLKKGLKKTVQYFLG